MRVLLLGDYSNYNRCLSMALTRLGHEVTVASDGCRWMKTGRDIDISRRLPGKAGGLDLWLRLNTTLSSTLKGYDVVQINNPIFLSLRPNRIHSIFNRLKRDNGAVFLTAMANDTAYINQCVDKTSPLRYNEWMVNGKTTRLYLTDSERLRRWLTPPLSDHCRYIYDNADGVVTVLYEYHLACLRELPEEKVTYAGIPIDVRSVTPVEIEKCPDKVRFFLGMHRDRKVEKGTDRLFEAVSEVARRHPDRCTLEIVENLPYDEYLNRMRNAHVVIDQLYSYTPATNALLAMAMGLNTVSGGEPEYYDFIGEKENHPIINALPDDNSLFEMFTHIAHHPEEIAPRGAKSREFVLRHNDSDIVAQRFVNFWKSTLNKK